MLLETLGIARLSSNNGLLLYGTNGTQIPRDWKRQGLDQLLLSVETAVRKFFRIWG